MTEYEEQAKKFLAETKTNIQMHKSMISRPPLWLENINDDFGNEYVVKLETPKGKYIFSFWDSIANKNKGTRPSVYSILSCLEGYEPEADYYEFCNEFGYIPSKQAEKIHKSVLEQWENLKRIYTAEQLEKLAEIS